MGYYLAKTLLEHGHTPTVIEMNPGLCNHLADSLDLHVILGDGTFAEVLESAHLETCEAMVAVTGRDENNLVACQLAKKVFGVTTTPKTPKF